MKTSLTQIVKDHYQTLYDARTDRPMVRDYVVEIVIPVGLGIGAGWGGFRFSDLSSLLAATSILSGLLFGVIIFVFQLRLSAASDPRRGVGSPLLTLLDELYKNVLYAVVVGLAMTVALVVASAVDFDATGIGGAVWTAVVVAGGLHFVLLVAMCLKRLRAAYRNLTE